MDIASKLNQANGRLRAGKIGVAIQVKGDRLYLRATFPPKPGATKQQPHQQRLALGFHANPSGVSAAEAQARKVGALLDAREFSWSAYLENSEQLHTIGSWVERFERQHWAEVIQNQASLTTWKTGYLQVFKKLPAADLLTLAALINYITTTEPDSRTRKRACDYCYKLAEFADLEGRSAIKKLTGTYSAAAVNPRSLPSDAQIATWRGSLPPGSWRWVVGMLACYGLRGHEVFRLDLVDFPIVRVLSGKTGARFIYPLYPEWVEDWQLERIDLPKLSLSYSNAKLGTKVAGWFYDRKAPFNAYDLRHCYARRCFEFGMAPDWAAGLMGHSVRVHLNTYRAWIDEQTYRRVYQAILGRSDRPLPPTLV
ncbi:site-specific integrase [Aliterella atlantica]|uniref:Integrase n=1 Tax=Aliterella atlantica CENA595 TaxID=1618023 RepID=A0A0D8ZV70_9CYAN|nr:integrase [Aliterella atlantica]KJH72354.1 integrase [Aliterella atlantica CENA595]